MVSRNPEKLCDRKTGELDVYVPDGGQEKKAWMNPPSSELGMAQDVPQKNMDLWSSRQLLSQKDDGS